MAQSNNPQSEARCFPSRFFYFFIFYFRFLQKYIFDLEIYRNIPRPPGCRAARSRPPDSGAAGAFLKKISRRKLRAGPWGPVAPQPGGRQSLTSPNSTCQRRRFFYFLFSFFIKIYFRFGNLQEYTPAAPLSGGRGT